MRRVTAALLLLAGCRGVSAVAGAGGTPYAISLLMERPPLAPVAGDKVVLDAHVTDSHGEVPVGVTFQSDPPDLASLEGQDGSKATFVLKGHGTVTFTACVQAAPATCASLLLAILDGKPVLTLDQPAPGAELDDPAGVVVQGHAIDGSGALQVFVNGELAPLGDAGAFSVTVPPLAGIQHLEVVASDGRTQPSSIELDVLHATAFIPASGSSPSAFLLDPGVPIRLGQKFFDDGVAQDPASKTTGDIADLLTVALSSLDIPVPDPIQGDPDLALHVQVADKGRPSVTLSVVDGGLDMYVRLDGLALDTTGKLALAGKDLDLAGRLTVNVAAHALVAVEKADASAEVTARILDSEVDLDGLSASFVDPQVAAVFSLAEGSLQSTLETQVRGGVGGLLQDNLPSLLTSVLGLVDHLLAQQTLVVDAPPLTPVTLHLDGRIAHLAATEGVGIDTPLQVAVAGDSQDLHPASRGLGRLAPPGELRREGSLQLGASLTTLDAVLHVLWSSGLFDVDLLKAVPQAGALVESAQLVPRLPPVLRLPRPGEKHDLVFSLGQLEIDAVARTLPARFGVNLEAGVDLSVDGSKLALSVSRTATVHAWAIDVPEGTGLNPALVEQALSLVWPQIASAVGSLSVGLELPAPAELSALSPALDGLTLALVPQGPLGNRGDLLVLDAALTGTLK